MRADAAPMKLIEQLKAWFFGKDRSIVLADNCFIELEEMDTPPNPPVGRRRLYAKADGIYELDHTGAETQL